MVPIQYICADDPVLNRPQFQMDLCKVPVSNIIYAELQQKLDSSYAAFHEAVRVVEQSGK